LKVYFDNFSVENDSIELGYPVYKDWLFFSHIVFVFPVYKDVFLLTPVKWWITVLRDS
jgi:hypothetical protein